MQTITLKIDDNINEKFFWLLNHFSKNEIKILEQLENELKKLGWWFFRHGGKHDIWTNGFGQEPIPRHNEVNEKLARSILRKAKKG